MALEPGPPPTRRARLDDGGAAAAAPAPAPAMDEIRARVRAVHGAYAGLWADFLQNRRAQAEERATALLRVLGTVPDECKDAETWVAEADFWYIAGAMRGNDPEALRSALAAYGRSLAAAGGEGNANARRMRAEAFLRLHRYEEAFAALGELAERFPTPWAELEAAPFRMRHDAELCERLARLGRLASEQAAEAASALRGAAERVEAARGSEAAEGERMQKWPAAGDLGPEDAAALRRGLFGQLSSAAAPYPPERFSAWAPGAGRDPLSTRVDWERVEAEYCTEGITVVDDFFSPEALSELWDYSREATCFCTVRRGYLGAFPADGNVHPLLVSLVLTLERQLPRVLEGHPLGLWWLFKYSEASPSGIGIHADAAAVNFNIWLTPDEARRSGGGLDVYMQLPPDEAAISEFNRDFATEAEEAQVREALLAAGGVRHVDYKQNRAVIFVSDLFHASEPFEFVNSSEQPRVNLTLLFGDRAAARLPPPAAPAPAPAEGAGEPAAGGAAEPGWDLFE